MTAPEVRLERGYRRLLRCYPRSWRQHREEEVVSLLMEQAAAEQRSTIGPRAAVDLIGHGLEARLDTALRWLPWRLREQFAMTALVVAAGLSLVMLVGEIIGAHYRPPANENYGPYFISGPFLTIGVGMYVGYLTAALLCLGGRAGLTRLLVLLTTAYAALMPSEIVFGGYPRPRLLIVVPFVMLGVLGSLATIRPTSSSARRLVGYGAAFVGLVGVGVLVTKPVLDWSMGTITTSGNVAFMALATVLPFICAAALVYASLTAARRSGWLTATAVTIFPLVVFTTAVNQIVTGPNRSDAILLMPLYYALAVVLAIIAHRIGRRRPSTS